MIREISAAEENTHIIFTRRVVSGHPVYNVTSRTQPTFITKKSSSMLARRLCRGSLYATALIYHSAVYVRWHSPPSYYHPWSDPSSPSVYAYRLVLFRLQLPISSSSPSSAMHLRFLARDFFFFFFLTFALFSHSTISRLLACVLAADHYIPIYTYASPADIRSGCCAEKREASYDLSTLCDRERKMQRNREIPHQKILRWSYLSA